MWRIDMADLSSLGEDKWNITCTDDDEFVIIEGGKLRHIPQAMAMPTSSP